MTYDFYIPERFAIKTDDVIDFLFTLKGKRFSISVSGNKFTVEEVFTLDEKQAIKQFILSKVKAYADATA